MKDQSVKKVTQHRRSIRTHANDESGAILILAMVFLVSVLVVVGALATWVMNDLNNTSHFSSSTHYAASGTMDVAVAAIRYTPLLSDQQAQATPTPLGACWTPTSGYVSEETLDNATVAVWCSTVENLSTSQTRVVSFYACLTTLTSSSSSSDVSAAASQCQSSPLLSTVVTFDDYPPGGSAPLTKQCSLWCGQGMFMQSWVWA